MVNKAILRELVQSLTARVHWAERSIENLRDYTAVESEVVVRLDSARCEIAEAVGLIGDALKAQQTPPPEDEP